MILKKHENDRSFCSYFVIQKSGLLKVHIFTYCFFGLLISILRALHTHMFVAFVFWTSYKNSYGWIFKGFSMYCFPLRHSKTSKNQQLFCLSLTMLGSITFIVGTILVISGATRYASYIGVRSFHYVSDKMRKVARSKKRFLTTLKGLPSFLI